MLYKQIKKENVGLNNYVNVFKNNHAVMLLIDPHTGNIVDANPAACTFYGYTKEDITRLKIFELEICQHRQIVSDKQQRATREKQQGILKHRLANGEVRDVEIHRGWIFAHGRSLLYLLVHDITERQRAENAVQEAYGELNQIFNSTPNPILVIGLDNKVIKANQTMLTLLGIEECEIVDKNCNEVCACPHCQTEKCPITRTIAGANRVDFESEKRLQDGRKMPFIITSTPYYNVKGQLVGIIQNLIDISERKKAEEQLISLAHSDSLTNLPNRTFFNEQLKLKIDQAGKENKKIAVMFLDLDGFKDINDSYGHPVGDTLLQMFAARVKVFLRDTDIFARWGGDEFTIFLPEVKEIQDVSSVAQRIVNCVEKPFFIKDMELFIGVSIGISIFPEDGKDIDTLIKNADSTMYHAKRHGKGNFKFYDSRNQKEYQEKVQIKYLLKRAIYNNELELYYQPQVDITEGRIVGLEALIRWNNPALGRLSPAKFIPLAEESGLILAIGRWVLRTACAQNMAWQEQGLGPYIVSVNISASQLQYEDLAETVENTLRETGLEARYLGLEVTESIAFTDLEQGLQALTKIKDLGVKILLDDFGVGYSALSCLKKLPLDCLKIDRLFLKNIATDQANKAITKAIIDMAHALGLYVTAEGVETLEELAVLQDQQCDSVQGYLTGKPLSTKEITAFMKDLHKKKLLV